MLKLALAVAAATASASAPQALSSTSPWWEKITVTMVGDGDPQSCTYESNLSKAPTDGCEVVGGNAEMSQASTGSPDEWTRITFERRFVPGNGQPQSSELHPGDTLLGGQIMALAIDGGGKVNGCKVIAKSGEVTPDYGCEEASAERFQPTASDAADSVGFMTIMVYGHSEHVA